MKCKSCGAEVSSEKRFCPKCGMPLIDHEMKAQADNEKKTIDILKKINELRPQVDEIKEKKKQKKEEEMKEIEKETLVFMEESDKKSETWTCETRYKDDGTEVLVPAES